MNLKIKFHDPEFPIEQVNSPEDALIGELEIFSNKTSITRHSEKSTGKTRNEVFGEVAGITEWIIENWSRIFKEVTRFFSNELQSGQFAQNSKFFPDEHEAHLHFEKESSEYFSVANWLSHHRLGAKRSNLLLPCIVFAPEEEGVIIQTTGLPPKTRCNYSFSFKEKASVEFEWVETSLLKKNLSSFVNQVLKRAAEFPKLKNWYNWLTSKWEQAQLEIEDPLKWQRMALGEPASNFVDRLSKSDPEDGKIMRTFLLDCRRIESENELGELSGLLTGIEKNRNYKTFALKKFSLSKSNSKWFDIGYSLATNVREYLGHPEQPLGELFPIFEKIGIGSLPEVQTDLVANGIIVKEECGIFIFPGKKVGFTENFARSRFGFAASFGRLIYEFATGKQGSFGAGQGDFTQCSKNAIANAFAVEFFLPRVSLRKEYDPKKPRESNQKLALKYGITPLTVAYHAFNDGLIKEKDLISARKENQW